MSKYYKHPQHKHVNGFDVATPEGRLAWPSLVTMKPPKDPLPGAEPGKPRHEITFMLDKTNPAVIQFEKDIKLMTDEMLVYFNEGRPAPLGTCKLWMDGDEFIASKPENAEKYPYYKGMYVLNPRNYDQMPDSIFIDASGAVIPRSVFVGGMVVRATIMPRITAHGIGYKLKAMQLVRDDGTRYGGGTMKNPAALLSACAAPEPAPVTTVSAESVSPAPTQPTKNSHKGMQAAIAKL